MINYSYEKTGDNFRVRDKDDNRIATCYDEGNAAFIARELNELAQLRARIADLEEGLRGVYRIARHEKEKHDVLAARIARLTSPETASLIAAKVREWKFDADNKSVMWEAIHAVLCERGEM